MASAMTPQQQAQQAAQQNFMARSAILANAQPMLQQVQAVTFQPESQNIWNIPPLSVGLLRGFFVKIDFTITNPGSGSSTLNRTPIGPANILENVTLTDLQNYQRINTDGAHLALLNSIKQERPLFSTTPSDSPMGFGANYTVISAPATIAAGASADCSMWFYIPVSYSGTDLTAAIYLNVINTQMNVQYTIRRAARAIVANTSDPSQAIYQGAGAVAGVTLTNCTLTVYQDYLDQLPMYQTAQGPKTLLPVNDLSTIYELKSQVQPAPVAGNDNQYQYSNFRHFLSQILYFNNQLNGVRPLLGADVNYVGVQSANLTFYRRTTPSFYAVNSRYVLDSDLPIGFYLFDSRGKPVYTTQTGNTSIVLNPVTVNTGASVTMYSESLGNVNQISGAAILTAN